MFPICTKFDCCISDDQLHIAIQIDSKMTFENVALTEIIAHWPSDNNINDSENYQLISHLLFKKNGFQPVRVFSVISWNCENLGATHGGWI